MDTLVGGFHRFEKANLHPKLRNDPRRVHMAKAGRVETQSSMRRVILFATVASGFVAAYLMYRRGESLGSIAKQTITNPIGSLVSEVKTRANG
jgi:hypothetical protein